MEGYGESDDEKLSEEGEGTVLRLYEKLSEEGEGTVLRLSFPPGKLERNESSEESEGTIFCGELEDFCESSGESSR